MRRSQKREVSNHRVDDRTPPIAIDERLDLVDAVRALPFRQRQAIILFYFADLPLPVTAEFMRISEGAVKAHLAQARTGLRRVMEVPHA